MRHARTVRDRERQRRKRQKGAVQRRMADKHDAVVPRPRDRRQWLCSAVHVARGAIFSVGVEQVDP